MEKFSPKPTTDDESFWKILKARVSPPRNSAVIDKLYSADGSVRAYTTPRILDVAKDFYLDLYKPAKETDCRDYLFRWAHSIPAETKRGLAKAFTENELYLAIQSAPNNSSPGPDGIPFEFYKSQIEDMAPRLARLANYVMAGNALPISMTKVLIHLLPKKLNSAYVSDYRPISLIDASSRIISRAMLNRLRLILDSHLQTSQAGFTPNRRGEDNINNILYVMDRIKDATNAYCGIAEIDFNKAFDRISHSYLEKVLEYNGFPPNFIHLIMQFTSNQTAKISINNHCCDAFPLKAGVRQGNPISPVLFNLALDPLLAALAINMVGIQVHRSLTAYKVAAFADDLAIITLCKKDHRIAAEQLDEFAYHSGSIVSHNKSKFYGATKHDPKTELHFPFTHAQKGFKHLGIHTVKQDWTQSSKTICAMKSSKNIDDLSLEANVAAFNNIYLAKIYYYDLHHPITNDAKSRIERHLNHIKGFWVAQEVTQASPLYGGLGVLNLLHQLEGLRAKFVLRLFEMPDDRTAYFKLRLQADFTRFVMSHTPDNCSLWEVTKSTRIHAPWWEFICYNKYLVWYKNEYLEFTVATWLKNSHLLPREIAWLEAWFNVTEQLPGRVEIDMKPILWEQIMFYVPERKVTVPPHKPPLLPSHFNHRSRTKAEEVKVPRFSQLFRHHFKGSELRVFWNKFHKLQKKYQLDYIKLFHLGRLDYIDPKRWDIKHPEKRPFAKSNWLKQSLCFLCLRGNNLPYHIYGECSITALAWSKCISLPRPKLPELLCNLNFPLPALEGYYRVVFHLHKQVVRMHAENIETPREWFTELFRGDHFEAYINCQRDADWVRKLGGNQISG